jgi:hypothetical protein
MFGPFSILPLFGFLGGLALACIGILLGPKLCPNCKHPLRHGSYSQSAFMSVHSVSCPYCGWSLEELHPTPMR